MNKIILDAIRGYFLIMLIIGCCAALFLYEFFSVIALMTWFLMFIILPDIIAKGYFWHFLGYTVFILINTTALVSLIENRK